MTGAAFPLERVARVAAWLDLEPELRFIREDAPKLTHARLALVRATQVVVATGLGILGVTPMDEMR